MPDAELDTVRTEFARLTGLFEDAALVASEGQGIETIACGRRRFRRLATAMRRLQQRLAVLAERLR